MKNEKNSKTTTSNESVDDLYDVFGIDDNDYLEELASERRISFDELRWRIKKGYSIIPVDY